MKSQKYETTTSGKHKALRKSLFSSLETKEKRYKHNIPTKAVGRTLRKHGLKSGNVTEDNKFIFATFYDKKGASHGEAAINKKTKKVTWWRVY